MAATGSRAVAIGYDKAAGKILGADAATGATLWRRTVGPQIHGFYAEFFPPTTPGNNDPLADGTAAAAPNGALVTTAFPYLTALDPVTGENLWQLSNSTPNSGPDGGYGQSLWLGGGKTQFDAWFYYYWNVEIVFKLHAFSGRLVKVASGRFRGEDGFRMCTNRAANVVILQEASVMTGFTRAFDVTTDEVLWTWSRPEGYNAFFGIECAASPTEHPTWVLLHASLQNGVSSEFTLAFLQVMDAATGRIVANKTTYVKGVHAYYRGLQPCGNNTVVYTWNGQTQRVDLATLDVLWTRNSTLGPAVALDEGGSTSLPALGMYFAASRKPAGLRAAFCGDGVEVWRQDGVFAEALTAVTGADGSSLSLRATGWDVKSDPISVGAVVLDPATGEIKSRANASTGVTQAMQRADNSLGWIGAQLSRPGVAPTRAGEPIPPLAPHEPRTELPWTSFATATYEDRASERQKDWKNPFTELVKLNV